jgi:hypothetical protein
MIKPIYKLNKMGLKQLPYGRPVDVKRILVDPKEKQKCNSLSEKGEICDL